jgi:hypothetical protein
MNMAETLNLDCLCSTLQARLLPEAIQRPHLFSATPVFISAAHHAQLVATVGALHRAAALPQWQNNVLERSPGIAALEFGPRGAFMGYDFHLGPDGPRLIEINTNAGGALLHASAARAHRACCEPLDRMFGAPADLDQLDDVFVAMFRAEWRAQRHDAPLRTIAIVDDDPASQYLAPEFELARQMFVAAGIEAVVLDPAQLEFRDGGLRHGETRIDLVYNRLTDFDLSEERHRALHDAYAAGAAVVTPHPRAHAMHADKRNLIVLGDAQRLASWGLAQEDLAVLRRVVPTTIGVNAAHADDLWSRRRTLFFKPATGFGSKAAYRGDKLTRRAWSDILAGEFVAQALVPPTERLVNVDGIPTRLKFDVRAYAYDGHIQLLAARTYAGQTTNFRTAGGGFSPVVVLDERQPSFRAC